MRHPSSRYADLVSEEFGDVGGINQTLSLKALAGGNKGGASTDYADGISFRKRNIATDGLAYARFPYDGTSILSGIGRGLGLFQFYDNPMDFFSAFGMPTATNNSTPAEDLVLSSWNISQTAIQATLASPTAIGLSQLISHTALNGYDIIADGVNFNRIAGSSRNYAPILQQPNAPSVASSSVGAFQYSAQFTASTPGFAYPSGIAVDGGGDIFVADETRGLIYKFNSSYVQQAFSVSGVTLNFPSAIAVDGSGNIYVGDNHTVYQLNSSGVLQWTASSLPASLNAGAIVIDGSGNVWVSNFHTGQVYELNSSGVYQGNFAIHGGGQPLGLYIDGSGNFFVGVNGGTSPGVQKFNSSQVYQSNFTGYTFGAVGGITVDDAGNFDVCDFMNNLIAVFTSAGAFSYSTGAAGSGNGQFGVGGPQYMVYASNTLYISDPGNERIQIFIDNTGGQLSGDYAYCITLIDSMLNESSPSPLAVVNGLSANLVNIVVNLGGLQLAANNWAKIRVYRTLTNSNPVSASQNPTFYYVPGLDMAISPTVSTYTTYDNIPDTTLTSVNNYQMTNISYNGGALDNLPAGWTCKFTMSWLGVVFGANWTDPNGVNYPRRVMWSAATDNSQVSNGNITTWNIFDYNDVGDSRVGDILGVYPGLQGRAYIWCKNGTFLVLATGNAALPYDFVQISNQYGFYHHSVAEVTGGVMGMTKDGIALFNGALFTHISHNILKTLGQCTVPEGNSGAYDFETQRYYIAVCDSSLLQSAIPTVQGTGTQNGLYGSGILNSMRNEVIVYDFPTKRWEIYQRTPIQYFSTFEDNNGKEITMAIGMSSDIYYVTQGNACGSTYGAKVTGSSPNTLSFTAIHVPNNFVGKDVYIPFSVDADGTSFNVLTYKSSISTVAYAAPNSTVGLLDGVPDNVSSFMTLIDNAGGQTANTGYPITDNNNLFLKAGSYGFGIANLDPLTLALQYQSNLPATYYNNGNYINTVASNVLTLATEIAVFEANTLYTQLPFRWFNIFSSVPHLVSYMCPPCGYKNQEHRKKNFQYLVLKLMISGPLKIDIFMDTIWTPNNNAVPTTTIYFTGTNQLSLPNMQEVRIPLGNNLGYIMRARFTGIRGLTKFEMDDMVALFSWLEPYSAQ